MSDEDDRPPSNWAQAVRRIVREVELTCPHCTAANRPGATVIELGQRGVAYCAVCSYSWRPDPAA